MCVLQTPESDRNLYWPLDNGDSSMAILHGAAHCHVVRVMHSLPITSTVWTEEVSRHCRETHTAGIFIRSVCRHPIHRFQSLYYFVYFIPIFLLDFEYPFVLTKAWYLLCEFSRAHCYTTAGFANAEIMQTVVQWLHQKTKKCECLPNLFKRGQIFWGNFATSYVPWFWAFQKYKNILSN